MQVSFPVFMKFSSNEKNFLSITKLVSQLFPVTYSLEFQIFILLLSLRSVH